MYVGSVYQRNYKKVAGNILLTVGGGLLHGLFSTSSGVYQLIPSNDEQSNAYWLQKMKSIHAEGITDFPDPEPDLHKSQLSLAESTSLSGGLPIAIGGYLLHC